MRGSVNEGPRYDNYRVVRIGDAGRWTVRKGSDFVEFTQELKSPLCYVYVYRKTARQTQGKPELMIEHSLRNAGTREIATSVYDHNLLVMVKQPPRPDFTGALQFEIRDVRPQPEAPEEFRRSQIVYRRVLAGQDRFSRGARASATTRGTTTSVSKTGRQVRA